MKRALAERAKQSGLPNGVAPASPKSEKKITNTASSLPLSLSSSSRPAPGVVVRSSSSSTLQQPPKARLGLTSSASAPSLKTPSPRPKKRLREPVLKLEEEDEDDSNASAFYLRHQNRALASELRTLKYQLTRIERERDYRRTQCSKAVQSLNALQATWTQMEAALQCGQPPPPLPLPLGGQHEHQHEVAVTAGAVTALAAAVPATTNAPVSTGSGTSIELIGALLDSLAALGATTPSKNKRRRRIRGDDDDEDNMDMDANDNANDEDMDASSSSGGDNEEQDSYNWAADTSETLMEGAETQQLDDLLRITDNVAKRATTLQRWIWSLLHRVEVTHSQPPNSTSTTTTSEEGHLAQQQAAKLKAKNKTLKSIIKELARSRDEMTLSDKRVRRGLYRLAAGRVQLKEVLKAIVTSDHDKEAASAWMEVTEVIPTPAAVVSNAATATTTDANVKTESGETDGAENSALVAQLKKQLADLEQVSIARDEQIKKLLSEREDQIKRINSLILTEENKTTDVPTDQEVQRSDLYAQTMSKVATSERKILQMEEKSAKIKEEWSQALANAELARTTMEEMQSKHMKRWAEVIKEDPELAKDDPEGAGEGQPSAKTKAEEIVTLQHKLTQALENVRQAETTRKTLAEAVAMNESLQAKLEEIKAKYAALQAGRASSSSNNHVSSSTSSSAGGASTPKLKSSSSSTSATNSSQSAEKTERSEKSEKAEKLHRDYRRVRKELAAATASKEAAKAKLERTEKERDSLNQTNSRLLKQAAEKDEMNAKSLSTILHLKQLTDQITKEKDNLDQQVKSTQQLAVVSRLAANARERLSEEFVKERKVLEALVNEQETKCAGLAKEKELSEGKLSQQKAKMSGLLRDVNKAKERCEELASESTKLQDERQKMMESLVVAQRESAEAAQLSERLAQQSGGGGQLSGFTVEQLNTQVSVLKQRLICPVCNHRDKKCILLRCRHMFCKPCVDENIKNRSRKCPACGQRFDTKDVQDVWL